MRNGEKIWYCSRISDENAEVEEFDKPEEFVLQMPRVFSPISITVQPKNGFTDRMAYGETTSSDQRIVLTPYAYWHGKFKEGDVFYLDGRMPNANEEYYGQDANYQVDFVANQNEAIEVSVKKIINK